ncbi:MAG: hypothetical protein NC429_16650 [Lachnospiraceae bacterium]|nr:hypothetical protein [Lachnospiraceae bacterium]
MLSGGTSSFGGEPSFGESVSSSDDEEWMKDLQNLIGEDAIPEDDSDLNASINSMDEMDISDLLDGMGDMDDELEEISGLLKHADGGESADADMLALLEGIESGSESEETTADPFAGLLDESFADEASQEENTEEQPAQEEESSKKKKKRAKKDKPEKKRGFFGRKKRKGQADEEGEVPTELVVPFEVADAVIEKEKNTEEAVPEEGDAPQTMGEEPENAAGDDASGIEQESPLEGTTEEAPLEGEEKAKEKKPGFLARLFHALTQEEEEPEPISEENKEILNELEEEDKKSSKKKEKKSKKGDKKKKGKGAEAEGEDEAAEENEEEGKKGKKPKKEKKPKEKEPKEKGPKVKVLSKKSLLVLIAFCATIVGSVSLLSFFLPEYADKKAARDAYNAGDYKEVYTLLYDRNLNSSDSLIFNRAQTVRKMERRIESYENNLAMGKELEALDSLLKGVECYQTLAEADEFGVRQEVDALYQQICDILNADYGITAEEAIEINTYDSLAYTRRLHGAVYGTAYGETEDGSNQGEAESEELAEPSEPQDILPEEEGLIDG